MVALDGLPAEEREVQLRWRGRRTDRVLTAGHCVDAAASELQVVVGRRNQLESSVGQVVPVSRIARDPRYTPSPNYDVAVLTLAQPVSVTPATIGTATNWGGSCRRRHGLGGHQRRDLNSARSARGESRTLG